jgi:alkylation response protein AidB-like acyl-CoA dehydrogenase
MLTDRQEELVREVRSFVHEVIEPRAAELDRRQDPEESFSWEIVEEAEARGLRTLTLAPEFGGSGQDCLTTAIVIEELARGDVGVSVILAQTLKIIQTIQAACTDEQLHRILPAFREDPRYLLGIGITEPGRSSDYFIPTDDPTMTFATTATREAPGWRLNGKKHFISLGNRASLFLIFAQTDPTRSLASGTTCFLVPRSSPGFTNGVVHDKMGERLVNNAELIFQDCQVPDENVVGQVGQGFDILTKFFPASNAYAAASAVGVAQAAYDTALSWTGRRVQGGAALVDHDLIARDLARMDMLIGAARAYLRAAAAAADSRATDWVPTMASLPKVFASEVTWEVVTTALELHGGRGYMRGSGIEKLVRDAAAWLHSDGANRTLLLKAARSLPRDPGQTGTSE